MSFTSPVAGPDVGTIFNDAIQSSTEAVATVGNMYQQAQQAFSGSRREMSPQPQQNPYANVPNPYQFSGPQPPQQTPAYLQPTYGYGYANTNGYGYGSAQPQAEVGVPGYSNPMYGKGGY